MLEFTDVQKNYGALRVLDIPYFKLETGLYWLQGPNGAGKTTLLRIIAGILRFKGEISLQGHSLRKDPVSYRRLVSWGDAEPLYPGFLSGVDLLSFYRRILKPEPAQVESLKERLGVGSPMPWCPCRRLVQRDDQKDIPAWPCWASRPSSCWMNPLSRSTNPARASFRYSSMNTNRTVRDGVFR